MKQVERCKRRHRNLERGVLVGLAIAAWLGPSVVLGEDISWGLYERDCVVTSELAAPCGEHGTFHFGARDGGCVPRVENIEELLVFPRPFQAMPVEPPWAVQSLPPRLGVGGVHPFALAQQPLPPDSRAVAIDWADGTHGASVEYLLDYVSGDQVAAEMVYLDSPALAPLGDGVGDPHLLVSLCQVLDEIDFGGELPTLAVNMSFGRYPSETDPVGGACSDDRLSCQIQRVVEAVANRDVLLTSAGGNHHKAQTFPASLKGVHAAGSMDVERFFTSGDVVSTWETPGDNDAIFPTNALCLQESVTSSGSSWASAIFAGLYADAVRQFEMPETLPEGVWSLGWWLGGDCLSLFKGIYPVPVCSHPTADVVAGLVLGGASGCWEPASSASEIEAEVALLPQAQPEVPSVVEWVSIHHLPAPGSDPCIPCLDDDGPSASNFLERGPSEGEIRLARYQAAASGPPYAQVQFPIRGLEDDLRLNVTAAAEIDTACLDSVFLRSEDRFHRVDLPPVNLEALRLGTADALVLRDGESLLAEGEQASLLFVYANDDGGGCSAVEPCPHAGCFWSSVSILRF